MDQRECREAPNPCPFCECNLISIECSDGGPARRKLTYNARCMNCMASCAGYGSRELAVKHWNTRATPAQPNKAEVVGLGVRQLLNDYKSAVFDFGYHAGREQSHSPALGKKVTEILQRHYRSPTPTPRRQRAGGGAGEAGGVSLDLQKTPMGSLVRRDGAHAINSGGSGVVMSQAYPLHWPQGWQRTSSPAKSQFKTTLPAAIKNVQSSLSLFAKDSGKKVDGLLVSSTCR